MPLPPLDELKRLQQQATPGPWRCDNAGFITACDHEDEDLATRVIDINRYWESGDVNRLPDFQLAALAPDLLAEVIRMKEELGSYVRHLEQMAIIDPRQSGGYPEQAIAQALTRIIGEHQ